MRKMLLGLTALMAASTAHAAVFVEYVPGAAALLPGMTIVEDFEGYTDQQALAGGTNAKAFLNPVTDVAARPGFNSTGLFGVSLGGEPTSTWTKNFAAAKVFSFAIGSLDSYNSLTLLYSNGTSQTLTGAQIATGATADGNQSLPTSNGRVYYTMQDGDPLIVGATFKSTGYSFEYDDLATGSVPEPSTWAMMLLGFGVVGRAMRRRRQLSIASFA